MLENVRGIVVPLVQRLIKPSAQYIRVKKKAFACGNLCLIKKYGLSSVTGTAVYEKSN